MIRAGIIGLGKMGISHCSIINIHPDVNLVAVSDTSNIIIAAMEKYTNLKCFKDYRLMIDKNSLDCLIIAAPTIFHSDMVHYAMERDVHVFVEKPFCLNIEDGHKMVELAESKKIVNQVGYHNRFIGPFQETKRLLDESLIGDVYHFIGEAYGPVVLKEKGGTWRSDRYKGGGCLYDYASHVINLVAFLNGVPDSVAGTVLKSIFSKNVDDAVYSTLKYNSGLSGQLSVNWSDETYRKMSTQITILGTLGKIIVNAQECRIYLLKENSKAGLNKGWNIKYITDVTNPVVFNLRGEEYTAQIYYFIESIKKSNTNNINSFASALQTDIIIDLLLKDAEMKG